MKARLGWLLGEVTATVTGPAPEEFLNRCVRMGLDLWTMRRISPEALEVQILGRRYPRLCQAAAEAGCELTNVRRRGLPFFLKGFRRRYALLAGLALCLVLLSLGSRTILTIDVTGNETISDGEILSQLRLCGVGVGTYGPSIPIRTVENRMLLTMDQLSFFSLNLHGTRAEVVVREADPAPELEEERKPADVVSSATGIITQMEPWSGDAQFQEGDAVLEGETLISAQMVMDPPALLELDLGTMLVRAEGRVMAHTWHTCTAQIDLNAPGKTYTGQEITRYSLGLMGHRMNFYQNSGIPYPKYDTIIHYKSWMAPGGGGLPVVWEKETIREYTVSPVSLDPDRAEELLKTRLLEALKDSMDQGTVLQTDYQTQRDGDVLTVTLLAQCTEQIGRTRELDTNEEATGPNVPQNDTLNDTPEQSEAQDANDRTDSEH